ncbi:MAG: glycosyltransferase, partial [Minisyncoccia bacterium]
TSYFEGYGLSLVEAGLAGLPIVTTPVGIANELENGKEVYLCPQNDIEYMFKVVYDLIENNQKRENLSINIRNKIKSMLISKEEYLNKMKSNWQETAKKVEA